MRWRMGKGSGNDHGVGPGDLPNFVVLLRHPALLSSLSCCLAAFASPSARCIWEINSIAKCFPLLTSFPILLSTAASLHYL